MIKKRTGFKGLCVCLLLAVSACSQDAAKQGADMVGNETSTSWNGVRNFVGLGHDKKPQPVAQQRYCYRAYGDAICYPTPIPGQEERLTGYQESNGKTGYVLPPGKGATPHSTVSDAQAPPLKSVTVNAPPKVAAVPGGGPDVHKQLHEVIFDPAELEPKTLVPDKEQ